MTAPTFQCGDVVCELGQSLIGRAIQWFTCGRYEPKTWASHAGRMVDQTNIAEALLHFAIRPLDVARKVRVWRYRAGFNEATQDCMMVKALHYQGKDYGWWKNIAHAADGLLEKLTPFRHVYLFRRLIGQSDYPICSWETAWTFAECAGVRFGVPPNAATPDDIADWCEAHPEEWELIYDNVTVVPELKIVEAAQ